VFYYACLHFLYRREESESGTRFRPFNAFSATPPEGWDAHAKYLDAFGVRDAFLQVKTPEEAINFLRDTGLFHPSNPRVITWDTFQRWRDYAEAMHIGKSRAALLAKELPSDIPPPLVAGESSIQMHRMAYGYYDHSYFGTPPDKGELPDWVEEDIRLQAANTAVTEEGRELKIKTHRERFVAGRHHNNDQQYKLEQQFKEPAPDSYRIAIANASDPGKSQYWLVFEVGSTLEAIAAANYIDRIGGITHEKCPVCGKAFPIRSQKKKKTCDDKCQDTLKHRNAKKPKN
jgi:predicted nucleic acid-binding Zn ribbon protein